MFEIKSTSYGGHVLLDKNGNRMIYFTLEEAIKALQENPGIDKQIYQAG
jgi:hypothetical protein